ncbi:MAG: formate dehydrogenase accessory protein FdhE [Chloroflexi bacterium]|nr:formate dehydrogenase accessory protein FdhE [Chloroflexota bacterium]
MPAALPPTLQQLLDRRLAVLRQAHPDLDDALSLQHAIISTQLAAPRPPELSAFPLPRQQVVARLEEGVPLLHEQPAAVDLHFAADLFSRLLNALLERETASATDSPNTGAEPLIAAATTGRLDPESLFGEAFVQHTDHIGQIAHAADLEPDRLSAVATWAVAPILRAYASRLQPLLAQADAVWERGYCPICGGWPLLAEMPEGERAPSLRCAACASAWAVQRPMCPYCGNTDAQTTLKTLTLDGQARFHALLCDRCTGYLKAGRTFESPPAELLAVDDVASLHLDLAAIERGYRRPSGSGYRIELAVPDDEWLEELV